MTEIQQDYSYSLKPKNVYIKDIQCSGILADRTMHRKVHYSPAHVDDDKEYPRVHHFACKDCGLQFFVSISNTSIDIWEETNYAVLTEFGVPERKSSRV